MTQVISRFKLHLLEKEDILNAKQKRDIHFYSLKNFLIYYEKFPESRKKEEVTELLSEYFDFLEIDEWSPSTEKSRELFYSHIMKIGTQYNYFLGFKGIMGLGGAIFGGLLTDGVLFALGILKYIYYIPITTLILVGYNRYLIWKYNKVGKLYGPNY